MTYFQNYESRHEKGETWAGIEVLEGKIQDMSKVNIFEPLSVKKQIIKSATEAASMILKIDDVIASGKMKGPPPGAMAAEAWVEWVEWADIQALESIKICQNKK